MDGVVKLFVGYIQDRGPDAIYGIPRGDSDSFLIASKALLISECEHAENGNGAALAQAI
jgi:hypothetical protein